MGILAAIALAGLLAGSVGGLMSSIADTAEENADNMTAAAQADYEAEGIDLQMTEAETRLEAADQRSLFEISQQRVQQERAVGAQVAQNAASGLGGISKTSVADQVRTDFDTVIDQMDTDRQEMLRSGEFDIDMMERDRDLLTAEADSLEEQGTWETSTGREKLRDVGSIVTGLFAGMG